ncbi:MAG: hypothetical protein JWM80_1675 [Cyanobacteria bacterium RYN_339]|nr:hypothetical protein [Cyanobacteria bacterium RYN_339]
MKRACMAALAATTLNGCAWMLGLDHLPQPLPPFQAVEAERDLRTPDLHVKARYLGLGERIVTATTPLGRIARAVNPYGEDSLVFHVTVMNPTDHIALVIPGEATLEGPSGRKAARTLDDFRRRWPSWAIETPDHDVDRSAALEAILQTILLDRLVQPNHEVEGRIAFPAYRPGTEMTLKLPVKIEGRRGALALTWVVR